MTGPNSRRLTLSWLLVTSPLLLALLARPLSLCLLGRSALSSVVDYLYDDSYYYLEIAAKLAETGRSSLDGITLTNGYHPLWLLTLAALARGVGGDPWTLFAATCTLVPAIAAIAVLLALAWRRTAAAEIALLAGSGLAVTLAQYPAIFLQGMEPILAAPLFVALIVLIESVNTRRSLLGLSVVLALLFLTRIDSLVLVLAVITTLAAWRWLPLAEPISTPRGIGDLWPVLAIVVPVIALYFVVNQILFDSPVPVSGLAKSIGGPKFANWSVFPTLFGRWKLLAGLAAVLGTLEILAWRSGCRTTRLWKSIVAFAVATLGQALYYSTLSTWLTWAWYGYLGALLSSLLIARVVYLCWRLADSASLRLIVIPILLALLAFDWWKIASYVAEPLRLVRAAEGGTNLRPGIADADLSYNQMSLAMLQDFFASKPAMQVAMGDRAGGLAFWGRASLSVVQTEGLTLDTAYLRARRDGTAEAYFQSGFAIRYWIVDREVIPHVDRGDGSAEYVVADPIQGRVTFEFVPVYCFPDRALEYRRSYGRDALASTRFAFDFSARQGCSSASLKLIEAALEGQGLRQLSLPAEYDLAHGGFFDKADEDRDRRIGSRLYSAHLKRVAD